MVLIIFLGCLTRPSTQYLPWPSQLAQSTIPTSLFSKVLFQICSIASLRVPDVNSIKIIFHSFSFRFPFRFRLDFGLSTVVTGARNGFSTPFNVPPPRRVMTFAAFLSLLFYLFVSFRATGAATAGEAPQGLWQLVRSFSLTICRNTGHWPIERNGENRKESKAGEKSLQQRLEYQLLCSRICSVLRIKTKPIRAKLK